MMRKMSILFFYFVCALFFTSCATLFSSGYDEINITSQPEGATVWMDGVSVGKTPYRQQLDRSTFIIHGISLRLEGYETKEFKLGKTLTTAAIFNLSSLLSWATDATTGNMFEYAPRSYYIELEKKGKQTSEPSIKESTRFALTNHQDILKDLARGSGEHLNTYLQKSQVSLEKRDKVIAALRNHMAELQQAKFPSQFQILAEQIIANEMLAVAQL